MSRILDPPALEGRLPSLPGRDVVAVFAIGLLSIVVPAAVLRLVAPGTRLAGPGWIADALCGTASLLVLASLSARIFRSRGVAWSTAAVAAAGYFLRSLSPRVASEPLTLILTVSGFLLLVTVDRPSSGCGVAAGIALGAGVLLQPFAAVLAPLLLAPLFDRRFPPAIRRVLAGSAIFGFAAVIAAESLRRGIRDGIGLPGRGLPGSQATSGLAATPALPVAGVLWLGLLLAFGIRGWLRAERRGIRIFAVAALGLALALPFRSTASRARISIVDPLLSLYGAAGILRTARPA